MASSDHTGDHHGSGSFPADPMHQFEIKRLLDINIAGSISPLQIRLYLC